MRPSLLRGIIAAAAMTLGACPHDFTRAPESSVEDVASDSACAEGLSLCGGSCVDTKATGEHCGGCGQACAEGLDCLGGSCVCRAGGSCDGCCDGDACVGHSAQSGARCGEAGLRCKSCDDGLPCTYDACAEGVCDNPPQQGSCAINGACYADGDYRPSEPPDCWKCDAALQNRAWSVAPNPGCVTTVAGSGAKGFLNGPALLAVFSQPTDVAVGADGTVYVADADNHVIRAVAGGVVSTFSGTPSSAGHHDGEQQSSRFNRPVGLAIDGAGALYVAEQGREYIRRIADGLTSTIAGEGSTGHLDGPAASALFDNPSDVAVSASGEIYVVDTLNACVRRISSDGGQVVTVSGIPGQHGDNHGGPTEALYKYPAGIALGAGVVYIADSGNDRIKALVGSDVQYFAGSTGGFQDNIAIAAQLRDPTRLAVDAAGVIFFVDTGNNAIRKVEGGDVITLSTKTGTAGYLDGPASSSTFSNPSGIDVDDHGIYIADTTNNRIRVIHR